ncbi:hypothetical protein COEREDRAFT_84003 [Coemansia reversa NRRL 1564]|uniref:Uncharacterized protein n=1 Tax=Coemansia reversa (strain ATCC 12441 / NRRL 1564) TaxID=763665 RepID=A0A2G5B0T2_COERN|nr:hypothetical protein COEREDRAFT_84003 [Coemansia reversa NRRL 1564]|eukprot:PIA12623.1 hypothetical protein COEREDRAFT_84003 [Coemansia reversa NRRL 1564]
MTDSSFKREINRVAHELSLIYENLIAPTVNVELEARMTIPFIESFEGDERTITYFRCPDFPSLTIRKPENKTNIIETKELVEKRVIENVTFALSIEKTYTEFSFRNSLIPSITRTIRRKRIRNQPNIDITEENGIFTVEIEFNNKNYNEIFDIIKSYKVPFWPSIKPKETHSSEILGVVLSNRYFNYGWCISTKADGVHVLLYCYNKNVIAIDDSGRIFNFCESVSLQNIDESEDVYEAELMQNEILIFDCLKHNNKNVTEYNYLERLRFVELDKYCTNKIMRVKPIHEFINFEQFCKAINNAQQDDVFSDGFILTSLGPRTSDVFKSKEKPTVDLLYSKGFLFLSSEKISTRVSKNDNYPFIENCIYEFSLDLEPIKQRNDKIIPNYYIPPEVNPFMKIAKSIGVPCLRYHHNKIKYILLQKLPKKSTLLDIGSGKGGDLSKWNHLHFSKVYAVDPDLELRNVPKFVVPIKDYVQNIPPIQFDCVSILFVPWNKDFLNIIEKAKYFILATMDYPSNYECNCFKCEVEDDNFKLHIPNSQTALDIQEKTIDIKKLIKYLNEKGWKYEEINFPLTFASEDEKILSNMYSFYFFELKSAVLK